MGKSNTITGPKSGQILIMVVLLSTVLLIIGLSTAQLSTEETRIAKLEADSKKALAAAEAGLEASLQSSQPISDLGSLLGGASSGITGSTTIQTVQQNSFTTPLLHKDEQYTFYLSQYSPADPEDPQQTQNFGTAYPLKLKIDLAQPDKNTYCTAGGGVNKLAVELTFINADVTDPEFGVKNRLLIDSCSVPIISGGIDKVDFNETLDLASFPSHILLLRIIAPNSNFDGASLTIANQSGQPWPAQGKTVVSTATTTTSVTQKIQLFQSYPQLTADFWVTSF